MNQKTERMLVLNQQIVDITNELSGLDKFNPTHKNKILSLYKQYRAIEIEGRELLK